MSSGKVHVPSHPDLFEVVFRSGGYCSALTTRKDFEAGEVMVYLTDLTRRPKSYATLQCGPGPDDHVLPPSDLVYVNHSCDPNAAFNLYCPDRAKWHMYALKRISVGDPVTSFYPSTEWSVEQPFECTCGALSCLRRIEGAEVLSKEELLRRGDISPWIADAIRHRDLAERHIARLKTRSWSIDSGVIIQISFILIAAGVIVLYNQVAQRFVHTT